MSIESREERAREEIEGLEKGLKKLEQRKHRRAKTWANVKTLGSDTEDLVGTWLTSGFTALILGGVSQAIGLSTTIANTPIPIDLALGVGMGVAGIAMKKKMLRTASAFVVGASAGRLATQLFHGPPVAAVDGPPAHHGFGGYNGTPPYFFGPGTGYGFGADPLLEAAREL